jgi:hypothetical protein
MQVAAAPQTFTRPNKFRPSSVPPVPSKNEPPQAPDPTPVKDALSFSGDRLVDLGHTLSAVPKFIYPTVAGTAQQQAMTWEVLDSLPMHHAVRPASIETMPSFSQGPNLLGVNRVAVGHIRINQGGYGMGFAEQFKETVVHEVGHSVDYKGGMFSMVSRQNESSTDTFGRGPFVSDYAETQPAEDFAETYKVHHTNPRQLEAVNSAKAEQMRRLDQPHWLEKLVDRPAYRETGKFIGRQFQAAPILRAGLEVVRQATVATLAVNGATQAVDGIVKGNGTAVAAGILNAGAGIGLALAPHNPMLGLAAAAALGGNKGLHLAAGQNASAAQQVMAATGGAVGGVVGGFVAPLALTQAGYAVAGPIGGTVGLLVGGVLGSHLGSTLGARAGLALSR